MSQSCESAVHRPPVLVIVHAPASPAVKSNFINTEDVAAEQSGVLRPEIELFNGNVAVTAEHECTHTHAQPPSEVVDPGDQSPADGSKPERAWLSSGGSDTRSQEVSCAWLALATAAHFQQTEVRRRDELRPTAPV